MRKVPFVWSWLCSCHLCLPCPPFFKLAVTPCPVGGQKGQKQQVTVVASVYSKALVSVMYKTKIPHTHTPGAACLIPHEDLLLNKIDSGFPEFPGGQGRG